MYWYVLLCTCIFHSYLQCYPVSDGLWCVQDTLIVVQPYPYSIAEEAGNSTPTIPLKFSKSKGSGFPLGCADPAALDGRRGCNVSKVNTWLWNFGSGKPRLGGLTVEETSMRKKTVKKDQAKRSAETRRRWREDGA